MRQGAQVARGGAAPAKLGGEDAPAFPVPSNPEDELAAPAAPAALGAEGDVFARVVAFVAALQDRLRSQVEPEPTVAPGQADQLGEIGVSELDRLLAYGSFDVRGFSENSSAARSATTFMATDDCAPDSPAACLASRRRV